MRLPLKLHWVGAAVVLAMSGLLSMMVLRGPLIAIGITAGATAALAAYAMVRDLPRLFLALLGGLLLGYALFGWRMASLGAGPVFIGEIILGAGVLAVFRLYRPLSLFRSPLPVLIVLFMVWGALRTVPFVAQYGVDAFRDAVVWIYAAFALLVAAALRHTNLVPAAAAQYARWLPVFFVWAPVGLLTARLLPDPSPSSILYRIAKPGDIATHLGGALAFVLLGLHRTDETTTRPVLPVGEWMLWGFVLAAVAIVAATTRGGLLAMMAPVLIVLLMRPASAGTRVALAGAGFLLFFLVAVAAEVSIGGSMGREISPRQLVENFWSIFAGTNSGNLEGTRTWRLLWWGQIIDYTVHGEYFWGGKGFGINLANSDGFQVLQESYLRSPHSIHMTILAREGVPGLLLWVLVQGVFVGSLIRGYLRTHPIRADRWARINLWILMYWLAFQLNASFDVYLEGPQGGIWFWSLVGFGIAVLDAQRRDLARVPDRSLERELQPR